MEKPERLKTLFQSEFTSKKIEYAFDSNLHQYMIVGPLTHRLYISADFIEKNEPRDIVQKARATGAIYMLKSSEEPRCLELNAGGVEEVRLRAAKGA